MWRNKVVHIVHIIKLHLCYIVFCVCRFLCGRLASALLRIDYAYILMRGPRSLESSSLVCCAVLHITIYYPFSVLNGRWRHLIAFAHPPPSVSSSRWTPSPLVPTTFVFGFPLISVRSALTAVGIRARKRFFRPSDKTIGDFLARWRTLRPQEASGSKRRRKRVFFNPQC